MTECERIAVQTDVPRKRELAALGTLALTCTNLAGAGDENRTRTISLGSAAVTAVRSADLASLAAPSDPG